MWSWNSWLLIVWLPFKSENLFTIRNYLKGAVWLEEQWRQVVKLVYYVQTGHHAGRTDCVLSLLIYTCRLLIAWKDLGVARLCWSSRDVVLMHWCRRRSCSLELHRPAFLIALNWRSRTLPWPEYVIMQYLTQAINMHVLRIWNKIVLYTTIAGEIDDLF